MDYRINPHSSSPALGEGCVPGMGVNYRVKVPNPAAGGKG